MCVLQTFMTLLYGLGWCMCRTFHNTTGVWLLLLAKVPFFHRWRSCWSLFQAVQMPLVVGVEALVVTEGAIVMHVAFARVQ